VTLPTLSVVLPTLNEEKNLQRTLDSLLSQRTEFHQIIIFDGGSIDHTIEIAAANGLQCVSVPRAGRGVQIEAGVRQVTADVVLVAHGDMLFPATACATIRRYLWENPNCPGGSLGHCFDSDRSVYRWIEWYDARRARRGMSYGDQAQFFRRQPIAEVGGFPNQPIMEDVELSKRMMACGKPAYLDLPVCTSPRRFEEKGILPTVLNNWKLRLEYRLYGQSSIKSLYARYYGTPAEK